MSLLRRPSRAPISLIQSVSGIASHLRLYAPRSVDWFTTTPLRPDKIRARDCDSVLRCAARVTAIVRRITENTKRIESIGRDDCTRNIAFRGLMFPIDKDSRREIALKAALY